MHARNETPITSYRLKLNQFTQNAVINHETTTTTTTTAQSQTTSETFNQQKFNNLIHSYDNNDDSNNCINKITQNICFSKKQTYEPHQQEQIANDKILRVLIDIYNSELNHLNLLKYAFEIYAEPLRKFSSLTSSEHQLLFENLEPIVSLSYNLTVKVSLFRLMKSCTTYKSLQKLLLYSKLEKLVTNWPYELSGSGKLFGKKFLQTYEDYLKTYPKIVKLLNQKLKEDEFREFCELTQLNAKLSLKQILSSPLERVHEYEQSLQNLINLTSNYSVSSILSTSTTNSIQSINQPQAVNYKLNDIQSSNLEYWKKMKEKCESLISLNNQMHNLDINKLTSLACVQQKFPNDNLNLFEVTQLVQNSSVQPAYASSTLPVTRKHVDDNQLVTEAQDDRQQLKTESRRLLSTSTKKSSSFVSKHFNVQRRKTIHDTVNIDLINNLVNQQNSEASAALTQTVTTTTTTTTKSSRLSSTSSSNSNNNQNKISNLDNQNKFHTSTSNLSADTNFQSVCCTRELIKQGPVTLINQYGKQDRYLFLFNDLLIISKQKNENYNKLKYRIYLTDLWLSDCFDAIFLQYKVDTSFVIGWPTANNFIADFKDLNQKELWLSKLKELIAIEKQKLENTPLNIKICFNRDNLGSTEPTKYSQCYTKTLQVTITETSREIVNRCKILFDLQKFENNEQQINDFQLWLKTENNDTLIPLIGHEFPYCIKMNFLRETGKSAKTDDNSLKFILIDKKSTRKNSSNKEIELDLDRANKLRKRMFWSRSSNTSNLNLNDEQPKLQSNNLLTTQSSSGSSNIALASTLTRPFSKLKRAHLFGVRLEKICPSPTNRLPTTLINLFEKVAQEGFNCLMIFRKSASTKLKKYYKEKIDANQVFDYNEMNVHVAALLLKEYLRDYPDGIINYNLHNECLNTLKLNDLEKQIQTTQSLLKKLNYLNHTCLRHFLCLFCYISSNSSVNKMDSNSISVCVAPSLFHKLDRPNDLEISYQTITFVRFLIDNCVQIFGADTLDLLYATRNRISVKSDEQEYDEQLELLKLQQQQQQEAEAQQAVLTSVHMSNNDLNMVSSLDSLKIIGLDTDSNDGHNVDSSIDDVIGTSSEIEIVDGAHNLNDYIKSRNKLQAQCSSSITAHDFSSNTLSVDSGLSVPTATSDPESEKSIENAVLMAKLHDRHAELTSNLRRQKRISSTTSTATTTTRTESLRDDIDQTVTSGQAATVQPKIYTKSDLTKRVNTNTINKYQKRVSTIMKQFSESDICCDPASLQQFEEEQQKEIQQQKMRSIRAKSQNDEDYYDIILRQPDTNLTSNLTRKDTASQQAKITTQKSLSKSEMNVRAYSLNDDLKKDSNVQAHSTPTKSVSEVPSSTKATTAPLAPAAQANRKQTASQANVAKSEFLVPPSPSTISKQLEFFKEPHHSMSSPRVSTSVYLPAGSKRVNSSDYSQATQKLETNEPTQTGQTNATATATSTTKRKVSKSKDDYRPSRHFVENIQNATQRRRNHSSDSSSDTGGSSSVKRSTSIRSSSISTASSVNEDNNSNRPHRTRRAASRHKNSISRAKSFSQQTQTDENDLLTAQKPAVQPQHQQHTNPNLIASQKHTTTAVATATTATHPDVDVQVAKIKRTTSLKANSEEPSRVANSNNHNESKASMQNAHRVSAYYAKPSSNEIYSTDRVIHTHQHHYSQKDQSSASSSVLRQSDKRISSSTLNVSEVTPTRKYSHNDANSTAAVTRKDVSSTTKQTCKSTSSPLRSSQPPMSTTASNLQPLSSLSSKSIASLAFQSSLSNNTSSNTSTSRQNAILKQPIDTNFLNVTWSVSSIRKQFEQSKLAAGASAEQQYHQDQTTSSMRINPRGVLNSDSSSYYPTITHTAMRTGSVSKNVPYKDIYGNPTTYI